MVKKAITASMLLAASTSSVSAVSNFDFLTANDMCVGHNNNCATAEECSEIAIGPCVGDETVPTAYLVSKIEGVALVDAAKYLDCAEDDPCKGVQDLLDPTEGWAKYSDGDEVAQNGYAYKMVGNTYGDMASFGAYVGSANYFNSGDNEISTTTNDVYAPAGDQGFVGPFVVCIADTSATDGECTQKRTFVPGAFKFSFFGYTSGSDFATGMAENYQWATHLGTRVSLDAEGFKVTGFRVNGKEYTEAAKGEQVEYIEILHETGGLRYDFPQTYNVGSTENAELDTLIPVTETKNIKINIGGVDATNDIVFIDYLVEVPTKAEEYFMYDPTVSTIDKFSEENSSSTEKDTGKDTTESSGASRTTVGLVAVATVVGMISTMLF